MNERLCSIAGCNNKHLAKGMCKVHYNREMMAKRRANNKGIICSVEGCEGNSLSRSWCEAHYDRWRKHGDVNWVPYSGIETRYCSVEGCEKKHNSLGYCSMHLFRFKKYGDPAVVSWESLEGGGYQAAHQRLLKLRGKASANNCIRCGVQAQDWAYMNNDPNVQVSTATATVGMPYSRNPDFYEPMCRSCHKILDAEII